MPRLITMTHEHVSLNAALGYAAVSGKPSATAAHVDAGRCITAARSIPRGAAAAGDDHRGRPPTAYPGSDAGARDDGGHIWVQQSSTRTGSSGNTPNGIIGSNIRTIPA